MRFILCPGTKGQRHKAPLEASTTKPRSRKPEGAWRRPPRACGAAPGLGDTPSHTIWESLAIPTPSGGRLAYVALHTAQRRLKSRLTVFERRPLWPVTGKKKTCRFISPSVNPNIAVRWQLVRVGSYGLRPDSAWYGADTPVKLITLIKLKA